MSKKLPISIAIITYNEEKRIGQCLRSLYWASEIVLVDSFSEDQTVAIAKDFGAKVYLQKFMGHIQQKQLALDYCSNEWVFCIDGDEVVSQELADSILKLFEKGQPNFFAYRVNRCNYYMKKWIRHGGWYPDRKIRLFHRKHGYWGGYNPHDKIILNCPAGKLKGDLFHFPFDDLVENVATNNRYSSIMAQDLFNQGKRFSLFKLIFKPFFKFIEEYCLKLGFLDGKQGFIIAIGSSYSMFLKQAKLFEFSLHQQNATGKKNG